MDPRLAHLLEARRSLQKRCRRQRHNRKLRKKIAELGREIERHSRQLCSQQWFALCSQADEQLHRGGTWKLLRQLMDETKSCEYQRTRMAQILHTTARQLGEEEMFKRLNERYLPITSHEDHPDYAGQPNLHLDRDLEEWETAFRVGISTKLDERVFAMEQMKMMPLSYLTTYIYPALYPLHMLDDQDALELEDGTLVCQPPRLQLSFENIDRHGCYALDTVDRLYLYVGRALSDRFCTNVLGVPNFAAIPEDMNELPQLETAESERVRNLLSWTQSRRPFYSPPQGDQCKREVHRVQRSGSGFVALEDSKDRHLFVQYMVDDRTESALSYYEFLQHLKQQLSK
ncbi:hypothetical protein MRX96_051278 [Rhipicephalus microplus]